VKVGQEGWKRQVSVSVLGGYALTGARLYWFPDPFDPITGLFAPNRRVAIGPEGVGNGRKLWRAEANSTTLGNFAPGLELVFGLWLPNNTWLYSGVGPLAAGRFAGLPSAHPKALLTNNPSPVLAGTDYSYYGWAVAQGGNAVDYNDFVFRTTEVSVTPEPATLSLLGIGLVGMGGLRSRRRRNRS